MAGKTAPVTVKLKLSVHIWVYKDGSPAAVTSDFDEAAAIAEQVVAEHRGLA